MKTMKIIDERIQHANHKHEKAGWLYEVVFKVQTATINGDICGNK